MIMSGDRRSAHSTCTNGPTHEGTMTAEPNYLRLTNWLREFNYSNVECSILKKQPQGFRKRLGGGKIPRYLTSP